MKVDNKKEHWPHEPWTIVRYQDEGKERFYALNTVTGDRFSGRDTYDEAMKSITTGIMWKKNRHAEPWGV